MPSDKRQRQREGRQERAHQTTRLTKRQQRTRQLRTLGIIIILVLVAGLLVSLFAGDGGDEEVSTDETAADDTTTTSGGPTTTVAYSNPELAAEVLGRDPPKPEGPPVDLAKDALEVETLIEGEGDVAIKSGDTVVVHYVGVLPEGAEFDQSWSKGSPFTTPDRHRTGDRGLGRRNGGRQDRRASSSGHRVRQGLWRSRTEGSFRQTRRSPSRSTWSTSRQPRVSGEIADRR